MSSPLWCGACRGWAPQCPDPGHHRPTWYSPAAPAGSALGSAAAVVVIVVGCMFGFLLLLVLFGSH